MDINEYVKQFGEASLDTIDCINIIIQEYNKYNVKIKATEKLAYILATVRHECGPKMLPITENLNYSVRRLMQVWPNRFPTKESAQKYANNPEMLGNKVYGGRMGNGVLEGFKFRGRGFVQITGYANYKKFSELLNVDLVKEPDLAKDKTIGARIICLGMINGLFTTRKLSGYIHSGGVDFVNARAIINSDVGRVGASIAKDAEKFLKVLDK